tara:strand:+ start:518 stop:895 length:378 start_codon:yes stop_codon:yes gene_type:complete
MEDRLNKQKDNIIQVVTRQTTLSYDEAKELLENNNYDYMKVIKESIGIKNKKEVDEAKSVNQEIYKQIRGLMDDSSKTYRMKKEYEERRNSFIEKARKEYQERLEKEKEKEKENEKKKLDTIDEN